MARVPKKPTTLEVGDRVKIVRPGKPWHDHTGTVVKAPEEVLLFGRWPRIVLEVEVDDMAGHRAGAETHEVRRING